jgi:tetratricopeptide (TPR) repeat protein
MSYLSTKNTEAYDLFLQAIKFNSEPPAKALLEKAIELDPSFSDAYAELAFYYIWNGGHYGTISREEVIAKAEPLAKRAIEIQTNCAPAHYALAVLNMLYKWDFKTVDKEFKIARQLSPSNSENIDWSIDFLLATGKFNEALSIQEKILEHHQENDDVWLTIALIYAFNDQPEKAYNALDKAWEIKGYDNFLHLNTIRIYNYIGRYREAIEKYDKYYRKDMPYFDIPYYWSHVGIAAYKTGDKNRSDTCLKKLLLRSEGSPIDSPCFFTAALYTAMGEKDNAIRMLEKAFVNREVEMYWLKSEPLFRPLHGDPRFENILLKIGFE